MSQRWVGIEYVEAEMGYTRQQAWAFVKAIGLPAVGASKSAAFRFTPEDFAVARDRAKAPIAPRRTYVRRAKEAEPQGPAKVAADHAAIVAAKRARLRNA